MLGFNDIKEHRWFKDIKWDLLLAKKIPAYYKPNIK